MSQAMTLEEQEQLNSYLIDEEELLEHSPVRSIQDMVVFILLIDAGLHPDDTPVKEVTWTDYLFMEESEED